METLDDNIVWGELLDKHIIGRSYFGKTVIRLNRDKKVSGIYLMFEQKQKFVPETPTEETIDGAKALTRKLIQDKIIMDAIIKEKSKPKKYFI